MRVVAPRTITRELNGLVPALLVMAPTGDRKKPLQAPYTGPYRVLERATKPKPPTVVAESRQSASTTCSPQRLRSSCPCGPAATSWGATSRTDACTPSSGSCQASSLYDPANTQQPLCSLTPPCLVCDILLNTTPDLMWLQTALQSLLGPL